MELMGGLQNLIPAQKTLDVMVKGTPSSSSSDFKKELGQFSGNKKDSNALNLSTKSPGDGNNVERNDFNKNRMNNRPPTLQKEVDRTAYEGRSFADKQIQDQQMYAGDAEKKSPQEETVDSLTRRAALQSFMKKMKEKLDVNPTEVVEAFSQLSLQELTRPPEENVKKIISFLELDPKEQKVAEDLFSEMLAQSSSSSLAEYLKSTDRELSLTVMSQQESRRQDLSRSLDQLNSSFFTQPQKESNDKGASPVPASGREASSSGWLAALGGAAGGISGAANIGGAENINEAASIRGALNTSRAATASSEGMIPSQASPNTVQNAFSTTQVSPNTESFVGEVGQGFEVETGWTPSASSKQAIDLAKAEKAMSESLQPLQQNTASQLGRQAYGLNKPQIQPSIDPQGLNLQNQISQNGQESGMNASQLMEKFGLKTNLENQSGAESGLDMSQQPSQELSSSSSIGDEVSMDLESFDAELTNSKSTFGQGLAKSGETQQVSGTTSSQFAVSTTPSQSEESANVREIVNQATFLIKKGGGEMKVALNPEGLGQVNMKVAVHDGQVNVEMITESSEAKKLIEKGLGDLKATLASHKLNVDNVRVDFSGEVAKQFDHAHDEAQRQAAHNFMEQFRQENGAWRQNFFDIPGASMPGENLEENPDSPIGIESSGRKKNSSRRLDLVA